MQVRLDGFVSSAVSCNNPYHDVFQFRILVPHFRHTCGAGNSLFSLRGFFADAPMSSLLNLLNPAQGFGCFVTGFGVFSNAAVGFDEH